MKELFRLTLALFVVATCAGIAIGFVHSRTADKISYRERRAQRQALETVFPPQTTVTSVEGGASAPHLYWVGTKGNDTVGYAFETAAGGYAQEVRIVVGVTPEGTILGISILKQAETPGLGDRIEEIASSRYLWNALSPDTSSQEPWFCRQFEGLDATESIEIRKSAEYHALSRAEQESLKAENAVTAITGATITTRAVVRAASQSIPSYLKAVQGQSASEAHP